MISTDFWWISSEELSEYKYIDLFHQEPYSDEPDTDRDPLSCPMLQSDQRHPLEYVSLWKAKFRNINVFRSCALYSSDIEGKEITGPLILDIDRTNTRNGGYLPDFDKALEDTHLLVKEFSSTLGEKSYRIFFTGHKGFHIEVHPKAIGISPYTER